MEKQFAVYMMASQRNGTIYTGVTSDLVKRVWQHKNGTAEGFTKDHNVKLLVWYEIHENAESAIHREKRLKKYTRDAKIKLIEKENKNWTDLYDTICK
jgi:putative endonuclease